MAVLIEALIRQSALVDAAVFVVVEGSQGRKWAGRKQLRDAYLSGTLSPVSDELELLVDPVIRCLKPIELGPSPDPEVSSSMMCQVESQDTAGDEIVTASLSEETNDETNPLVTDTTPTSLEHINFDVKPLSNPIVYSASQLLSLQPKLPSLPKLLPKPNIVIPTTSEAFIESRDHEKFNVVIRNSPTQDNHFRSSTPTLDFSSPQKINHIDLPKKRMMGGHCADSPTKKPRSLENDFDGVDDDDSDLVPEDEDTISAMLGGSFGEDQPIIITGQDDEEKTVYLIKDELALIPKRQEIIVQMPPTQLETLMNKQNSNSSPKKGNHRHIPHGATIVTSDEPPINHKTTPTKKMPVQEYDMEEIKRELTKSEGLESLQLLLDFLKTKNVQENPIVKPDSAPESLALDAYTWNRIHFQSVNEWVTVINFLRMMGPWHLFANRDSLTYKLFSAIMRQFSRAVAHECPYEEEKGDNVNRFLSENFERFIETFPKFRDDNNSIIDPRLRRNASSFRGMARKEVQKHYNEHLRNKLLGKLRASTHVLIPVDCFFPTQEDFGENGVKEILFQSEENDFEDSVLIIKE